MPLSINAAYPGAAGLTYLFAVDDDNVLKDIKTPARTLTLNTAATNGAAIGSGTYGRHVRTGGSAFDPRGFSISAALASIPNTGSIILITNGVTTVSSGGASGSAGLENRQLMPRSTGSPLSFGTDNSGNASVTLFNDWAGAPAAIGSSAALAESTARVWIGTRDGSGNVAIYRDGVLVGSGTLANTNGAASGGHSNVGGIAGQSFTDFNMVLLAHTTTVYTAEEAEDLAATVGPSNAFGLFTASGPVITGPTGAAGASSITHAVNELQAAAGTWSATGTGTWSLTGTDAADLAIAAGVLTKATGNFDREAKASYSVNVVYGAASQAVTLNITNVNEAPSFAGPDISVPGLVVGTPMASINAALLFTDPDSGDAGTYSAVGSWPAGITVSSAGLISGTPTTAGTYASLRVRRTDTGSLTADSNLFTITVSASATPVSFSGTVGAQSGTVGSAFSWAGSALAGFFSGSLTPFAYNVSAGSLPPGLTLNSSTGVVTGTPTTAGSYAATFRAVDTGSNAATSNSVAFTIAAAPSAPGFDFHTAAGCIFGAISGSLVGLAREVGVSITTRVYNASTGALVATLPATATDSNGRLPRLTDAALVSGTNYRLVFVWADGSAYTINMVAT